MDRMEARFTRQYGVVVLAVSGVLAVGLILLVRPWTFAGDDDVKRAGNIVKLVCLGGLMAAVFVTQVWDMARPRVILSLTQQGIHDRRLTRGPVLWHQIERLVLFRKGWQWMVRIEPKTLTTEAPDTGLGPMPLYAFNRLCARLLKRPELNVGLGGLTASGDDLMRFIQTHYKGEIIVAVDP